MVRPMRSSKRRAEREAAFAAECEARSREETRKEALSMWERIEEADVNVDVKDILHRMAQHIGLEE